MYQNRLAQPNAHGLCQCRTDLRLVIDHLFFWQRRMAVQGCRCDLKVCFLSVDLNHSFRPFFAIGRSTWSHGRGLFRRFEGRRPIVPPDTSNQYSSVMSQTVWATREVTYRKPETIFAPTIGYVSEVGVLQNGFFVKDEGTDCA